MFMILLQILGISLKSHDKLPVTAISSPKIRPQEDFVCSYNTVLK